VDEGYARLPGAGWCPYHLHLVPPPGVDKNLPTRARGARLRPHPPKPRFTLPTGPRFSSISELRIPTECPRQLKNSCFSQPPSLCTDLCKSEGEYGSFQTGHWSLCTVPHPHLLGFSRSRAPNSRYGGFDLDLCTVPHPEMAGLLSLLEENRHSWRLDWDLCTVLYFGHRGDPLKAVFDSAESPLQAALPQG
jgi:hypothetical protein